MVPSLLDAGAGDKAASAEQPSCWHTGPIHKTYVVLMLFCKGFPIFAQPLPERPQLDQGNGLRSFLAWGCCFLFHPLSAFKSSSFWFKDLVLVKVHLQDLDAVLGLRCKD